MNRRAKLIPINEAITLVNDADESTFYIVHGKERAMLIDTANGYENVIDIAREVTPLPLMVVNTHGHCDHIYGNIYCKEAWLHPADFALHDAHFSFDSFHQMAKEHGIDPVPCPLKPLACGQVFDLGGLPLEVVSLKGHTPGSIGLLDRRHRILFSGDGLNGHIWMQLDESCSLTQLRQTLAELLERYGDEFDSILTGHGTRLESKEIAVNLITGCDDLLSGKTENDKPYEWFMGIAKRHSCLPDESVNIIYNADRL